MAYDRDDFRRSSGRDPRDLRSSDRFERGRDRGWRESERDERGFLERAGDQIASWFGDEDDDDRRYGRDEQFGRDRDEFSRPRSRTFGREGERGYRPLTGDYGRAEMGRGQPNMDREQVRRPSSNERNQRFDPHYAEWRQRQIDALDRDYDDYRREHQSKFENDFGGWREQRQTKRQMLGQVREHMEVLGSDEAPVGTVDRVAGDRIILTKSDAEAGGAHHSLPCTMIGRVEGERVLLEVNAEQAKQAWRDESRDRALFEREDQGEAGPHMLDRSFSGTYR
ncbi:DUF2171 domain-containing protein [Sphingomonas sp.]|uniref:DUF2171 domain-containing protein n=1 Tax=Sphingomonas sp. TaxID=28214 RepID=UPI00286D83A9|nr:DUF2171 domain-containing protein [Sphingomonas sp.]